MPSAADRTGELPPSTDDLYEPPHESTDGEGHVISYADGRLTADVVEMPLNSLLMELGRQSGARVDVQGLGDHTVTDSFRQLPLDEALRRLVQGKSFSLIYTEQRGPNGQVLGTRLKEIHLYGGNGVVSTYRPPSGTTDPSRPTAAGPGAPSAAPAHTSAGPDKPALPKPAPKSQAVKAPKERENTEAPNAEPAGFANPVTAAILGKDPAPPEDLPVMPAQLPVPPAQLPTTPAEVPVPPEELDEAPAVEDVWYEDSEVQEEQHGDDGEEDLYD